MPSIAFETVKSQTEEKQKTPKFRQYLFHFQIFQTHGNLEIDFSINLKNVSAELSILSELRYIFGKILTHYKTDLKHAVTTPLHQGYCLTCTYGCMKFYCPKVRGS